MTGESGTRTSPNIPSCIYIRALVSKINDFEDAVLNEAGLMAGVDFIITRNTKDFAGSSLKVCDPDEFLALPA